MPPAAITCSACALATQSHAPLCTVRCDSACGTLLLEALGDWTSWRSLCLCSVCARPHLLFSAGTQHSLLRPSCRRTRVSLCLQADCAAEGADIGECAACGSRADVDSFHQLASDANLPSLTRRLGLESAESIMSCASTALVLLAYQEQLTNAKKRHNDKAQLKNITNQSKEKIRNLHSAAQKVYTPSAATSGSCRLLGLHERFLRTLSVDAFKAIAFASWQ